jgi:carbon-monoxide dehydrogenase large subunit
VRIEKHFAVDEGGRAAGASPAASHGHGGIARGIGEALHEEAVHGGDGQLLTGTLANYPLPRASQLPPVLASDAGAIGAAPAVANAVLDALHGLGVRHLDLPLTPEKVWRAMREACR